MYGKTYWLDEVTEYEGIFEETDLGGGMIKHEPVTGQIYVQGTPQDAAHWNNMENGIFDAHTAVGLLMMLARQNSWEVEIGTVDLTNTQTYPFNNSKKSVALTKVKENGNYVVLTDIVSYTGSVGEIVVSDKLTNGFKVAFTGSASSAKVQYIVIGGILK